MGMNSDIQKLASNAITKTSQKQQLKEYNDNLQYFKINIKELLQIELIEGLKNNEDIFNNDFKYNIINNVIDAYFINNLKLKNKYKNDLQIYFVSNYYNIANQSRLTYKKQSEQTNRQSQLKCEILEIKKQQEAEKLKKLQQQNAPREQVQQITQKPVKQDGIKVFLQIIKILAAIIFLPIAFMVLCVLAAAKNQK